MTAHQPDAAPHGARWTDPFRVAFVLTVLSLAAAGLYGGLGAIALVLGLGLLEVCVSFDNAVVNAGVLHLLPPRARWLFLTVGMAVACIGVRLLLPLVIVSMAARIGPIRTVQLALDEPTRYADVLLGVRPAVSAFGGIFLALVFLRFLLAGTGRPWIGWIERPARRLKAVPYLEAGVGITLGLALCSQAPAGARIGVGVAVLIGLLAFWGVQALGDAVGPGRDEDEAGLSNAARTFAVIAYLEVLDASYSVDSVMGAFSVTLDVVLITLGLSIGAAYIRGLTVLVAESKVLGKLPFVEHGAYYAIGLLAAVSLAQVWTDVPDILAAGAGVLVIGAAIASSLVARRADATVADAGVA
ncbi:DUF475 domain-containing protein [Catenulispora yoronensis]|uniref:DUF475 domain-containing protein n=1 Tax=Catenulispora yoronensis TaxID=450799 RepID=A0ABN2UJ35_9ACTN